MCSQFITSFGERQIRQYGTRILMISHLDFFLILTLSEFDWKGKKPLGKQFAVVTELSVLSLFN